MVDLLGLVSVWCDYGEILILVNIDSRWLAVLSLVVLLGLISVWCEYKSLCGVVHV